ncbi:polysaccharide biosynthesis C-terminal domain-containing protein [Bifidobacterium sp. ESL0798]|uniref:lipopolysaccharide biosynthesis protein n=1 Tax=Bifidobacterium sp. ESL0798 TaxID=2983235 RepID=UPI0023F7D827|nr:polysaccharide biosynthesis C-terminal domain-containing protein [Bifidobacterium sp. ESL0798]WEV74283.1 polysaccharide biosynthesis C-terminal domain-containing protein [Bifidobacterium sp. ESL0798]
MSAFGSVFSRAWSISAIVEYDSEDSKGFFGNTFSLMNFVMVLICSMILICNIPLAKILYAKDFFEAWHYTPFILFSVLLDTMTEFIGGVFTATRDTKAISYTTIIGAVVNVGLSFLLIPIMGALGAAVATLIGYSIVYGTRLILVRKYIHMKVSTKRIATSYILLLVQLLVSELGLVSIPIQILIFVVLVVVQWPEAKKVTNLFKKVYRKLF